MTAAQDDGNPRCLLGASESRLAAPCLESNSNSTLPRRPTTWGYRAAAAKADGLEHRWLRPRERGKGKPLRIAQAPDKTAYRQLATLQAEPARDPPDPPEGSCRQNSTTPQPQRQDRG
jgi:hypothetical protein